MTESEVRAALAPLLPPECHTLELAGQPGEFADLPSSLSPDLLDALKASGIERLFRHQAQAIESALAGEDCVISTGTSSGKTLCYVIPALQSCLREPNAKALLIYPTKALAQDQLERINTLAAPLGLKADVYDGDTPRHKRSAIRSDCQLILTNPDMLHAGILPGYSQWSKFLRSLRTIAIDEMHVYRGAFGSHVAWVLRRLLRLAAHNKSRPQILAGSATLPDPAGHARALTGRKVSVVERDDAPRAEKSLHLCTVGEASPNEVAARLLAGLAGAGVRTLAFSRSRISAELLVRHGRQHLERLGQPLELIDAYRAGYTPKERRAIEKAMFKGELMGLSATSAMELGVDVGELDVVVINGYPGTISSFWQQAGRSGRGGRYGAAVYLAHPDPLEEHLVRDPQELLASPERPQVTTSNLPIAKGQVKCAAFELPLKDEELSHLPESAEEALHALEGDSLAHNNRGWHWLSHEPPSRDVSIRGIGGNDVQLFDGSAIIGSMEQWRALRQAHEGAVYLHRDRTFVVDRLDLEQGVATIRAHSPGYFTEAVIRTRIEEIARRSDEIAGGHRLGVANVRVAVSTEGYRKMSLEGQGLLGEEPVELPDYDFETRGILLDLPGDAALTDEGRLAGAIHGAEHALYASAPLIAGCDRRDLGSSWTVANEMTLLPRIAIFEESPGGLGYVEVLMANRTAWLERALAFVENCDCDAGCPRCLLLPRCPDRNMPLDKQGARTILQRLAVLSEPEQA